MPQRHFYQGLLIWLTEVVTRANGGCRRCYVHVTLRGLQLWQKTFVQDAYCQHHNVGKVFKQLEAAHPLPWGPFVHIQMDFVTTTKCCNFIHTLVVVDTFTKWIEAYPCRTCDARTVEVLFDLQSYPEFLGNI